MTTVAVPGTRAGSRGRAAPRHGADASEPWSGRDRAVLLVAAGLGVLVMVIGWVGISGTVDLNEQAGWLAVGIGGLILAGLGMVGWLLGALAAVTALRRDVLAELASRLPATAPVDTAAGAEDGLGTAAGMRRYHRTDCALLAGKDARFAALDDHRAAGLLPCGVCRPPDGRSAMDPATKESA